MNCDFCPKQSDDRLDFVVLAQPTHRFTINGRVHLFDNKNVCVDCYDSFRVRAGVGPVPR